MTFKGLNIRIPIVIPIKGMGFINHGSGLVVQIVLFEALCYPAAQ